MEHFTSNLGLYGWLRVAGEIAPRVASRTDTCVKSTAFELENLANLLSLEASSDALQR